MSAPRQFFVVPRNAFAPREFGADVVEREGGVGEQNEQVIEKVGGLGDELGVVARCRGDHRLDRFLAELLRDPRAALGEQAGGVGVVRVPTPAHGDRRLEAVENIVGHRTSAARAAALRQSLGGSAGLAQRLRKARRTSHTPAPAIRNKAISDSSGIDRLWITPLCGGTLANAGLASTSRGRTYGIRLPYRGAP